MRNSLIQLAARISHDDTFVERCLLSLYQRHVAKDKLNPDHKGRGFSYRTLKEGVKLGRWLQTKGSFTDGNSRFAKTRAQHLKDAREILVFHIQQVDEMIREGAQNTYTAPAVVRPVVQAPRPVAKPVVQTVGSQTVIRRETQSVHTAPKPVAPAMTESERLREQLRLNLEMGQTIMAQLTKLQQESEQYSAEGPVTERRPSQAPGNIDMGMRI